MSNNNSLYSKPILFAVVAFVAIMVGTVVTTLYPLIRSEMHPKLDTLTPYTALELAGRDVYQREGCINCHSQTVRPLKADVLRYGEYSKPGENAYERPFLWGSRRTGPDLARIGGKYMDEWHFQHFMNPKGLIPGSNMPAYPWLANNKLNPAQIEKHMALFADGQPVDVSGLADMTELQALTAYMQKLGTGLPATEEVVVVSTFTLEDYENYDNKVRGTSEAVATGKNIFVKECAPCHGAEGTGNISRTDFTDYEMDEAYVFMTISNGMPGMMPRFMATMTRDQIASVVEYLKTLDK